MNITVTQILSKERRDTAKDISFDGFLSGHISTHKNTIDGMRQTTDQNQYKSLKDTLPACIFPAGIMQIDIDQKDNPHIADLKEIIKGIKWVAYAMHSAGGKGIFLLIRISQPAQFKEHFRAFAKYLKERYSINTDPAVSNPKSLRFWTYDPEPISNDTAPIWEYIEREKKPKKKPFKQSIAGNNSLTPFEDFNQRGEVESMLEAFGYTYDHTKGDRVRYTRPGKQKGTSIDWHIQKRTLYVFSSAAETGINEALKGYSPASVFIQLCANGDTKEAAKKLRGMGFGKAILKPSTANQTYRLPLPQKIEMVQPAPIKTPEKRFQTLTRDGDTWQVEINEYGYPAAWDN